MNNSDDRPHGPAATIAVTLTTSSATFSVSPSSHLSPFRLFIKLSVIQSMQPNQPITIIINDTIYDSSRDFIVGALGAFGRGLISTSDPERIISLGGIKIHYSNENAGAPNLLDRGAQFITIPGNGEETIITHEISHDRLFKYSSLSLEDIKPGETFKIHVNKRRMESDWWCWGDLEDDLKGKKLHAWQKGVYYNYCVYEEPPPSKEEIEKENYVLGEDPDELSFEDQTGCVEITIVE